MAWGLSFHGYLVLANADLAGSGGDLRKCLERHREQRDEVPSSLTNGRTQWQVILHGIMDDHQGIMKVSSNKVSSIKVSARYHQDMKK